MLLISPFTNLVDNSIPNIVDSCNLWKSVSIVKMSIVLSQQLMLRWRHLWALHGFHCYYLVIKKVYIHSLDITTIGNLWKYVLILQILIIRSHWAGLVKPRYLLHVVVIVLRFWYLAKVELVRSTTMCIGKLYIGFVNEYLVKICINIGIY